jgi:hypothetical protein
MGMEGLTIQSLRTFPQNRILSLSLLAIERVPQEGMAHGREVDTNLVGPSRLWKDLKEGQAT